MGQAMGTSAIPTLAATTGLLRRLWLRSLPVGAALQPPTIAGIRRPITAIATAGLFDRRSPTTAALIRAVFIIATAGEQARSRAIACDKPVVRGQSCRKRCDLTLELSRP